MIEDLAGRLEQAAKEQPNENLRGALVLTAANLRNAAHFARAAMRRIEQQNQYSIFRDLKLTRSPSAQ